MYQFNSIRLLCSSWRWLNEPKHVAKLYKILPINSIMHVVWKGVHWYIVVFDGNKVQYMIFHTLSYLKLQHIDAGYLRNIFILPLTCLRPASLVEDKFNTDFLRSGDDVRTTDSRWERVWWLILTKLTSWTKYCKPLIKSKLNIYIYIYIYIKQYNLWACYT
jgi:hypothetical protein